LKKCFVNDRTSAIICIRKCNPKNKSLETIINELRSKIANDSNSNSVNESVNDSSYNSANERKSFSRELREISEGSYEQPRKRCRLNNNFSYN
jgi:hypothetical protein